MKTRRNPTMERTMEAWAKCGRLLYEQRGPAFMRRTVDLYARFIGPPAEDKPRKTRRTR